MPEKGSGDAFLSIDIGNTTVVVGLFFGDEVVGLWRLSSLTGRTSDEISLIMRHLVEDRRDALDNVKAGIASVVPGLTGSFAEACRQLVGCEPIVVSTAIDLGIPTRYVDSSQIGPDRLANAAAVRAEYRYPAIVVDLGTTTNFDVIDAEGAFAGGAIAPGFFSSAEELFRRASRLPRVELRRPERAIGRTTAEAIRSGVVFGTVAQIDGVVNRIRDELGGDPLILATGGLASEIMDESSTIEVVDPALTLKGIRHIGLAQLRAD